MQYKDSIPELFVYIYFVIYYINNGLEFINRNKFYTNTKYLVLIILILLFMVNSFFEYVRAFKTTKEKHKINMFADYIIIISDKNHEDFQNFIILNTK